jgi:hypothetical protein
MKADKTIEMQKNHKYPTTAYTLKSLKNLYKKMEGIPLSRVYIDEHGKKTRVFRKRKQIIEDLVMFHGHSFPDLSPAFFKSFDQRVKKVKNGEQFDDADFFYEHYVQYKKKHPEFTYYDKDLKKYLKEKNKTKK